jgi:hypothetical protein
MENQEKFENSGFSPGAPMTRAPVRGRIAMVNRKNAKKPVMTM